MTAVGDMIFNQKISELPDPDRQGLFRIMQEADIGYGNLEFSINDRPELQRPFYNFRAPREFAWEVANIGINLVSMANNHALDFGPEGLKECLSCARSHQHHPRRGRPDPGSGARARDEEGPEPHHQVRSPVLHAVLDEQVPAASIRRRRRWPPSIPP